MYKLRLLISSFFKAWLFAYLIVLGSLYSFGQQKVGLVLSGGGIDALAHVGVIKALEENQIPIDYVSGTSMGALIGAMYACGYSPEELEAYFTSDEFILISKGEIDNKFIQNYQTIQKDAKLVQIKFDK